jgi:hypothetical protein
VPPDLGALPLHERDRHLGIMLVDCRSGYKRPSPSLALIICISFAMILVWRAVAELQSYLTCDRLIGP